MFGKAKASHARVLVWLIFLACLGGCANTSSGRDISHLLFQYHDSSGQMTIQDVMRRKDVLRRIPPGTSSFDPGVQWFYLALPPDAKQRTVYLEIGFRYNTAVDVYEDGEIIHQFGLIKPIGNQGVPYRMPVFAINRSKDTATVLWFRVESKAILNFPLRLYPPEEHQRKAELEYLILGGFLGGFLLMALYNLILGMVLRNLTYLYYFLYTLSLTIYLSYEDGFLNQFLLPHMGGGGMLSILVYGFLNLSGILFLRSFLPARVVSISIDRILVIQAILLFPVYAYVWTYSDRVVGMMVSNLMFATTLVLACILLLRGLLIRNRMASYLFFAVITFLAMSLLRIISVQMGNLENILAVHGVKLGIAMELLILSIALGDRYNRLKNEILRTRIRFLEEKDQFIREVHDTIGTQLSGAIMQLRSDQRDHPLVPLLEGTLERTRDFASVIRLSEDESGSLRSDLESYVSTINRLQGFDATLEYNSEMQLPVMIRMHIHRILQEWIGNAMRHGGSRKFRIHCVLKTSTHGPQKRLLIFVVSDGVAFSWPSREQVAVMGTGLRNIQNRCCAINGRVRSIYFKGHGLFLLRVPVE